MLTCQRSLTPPAEPAELRVTLLDLLARSPEAVQCVIDAGDWLANPLWHVWEADLTAVGWNRDGLREIVIGYRTELWLWVIGERPWPHAIAGLIGRIERRQQVRDNAAMPSSVSATRGA